MYTSGEIVRPFPVAPDTPHPLGRHQGLDGRSVPFMIDRNRPDVMRTRLRSVAWALPEFRIDQGSLGSCTGNAATNALLCEPFRRSVEGLIPQDPDGAEAFAVELYSDATRSDGVRGVWPPTDTGSTGLAVCRVLDKRKAIDGYRWASSARGLAVMIQAGPVLLGMPWLFSFFEPTADGQIDSGNWQDADIAGGHEVCVYGIQMDDGNPEYADLFVVNSWGPDWGRRGCFKMRMTTYLELRSDCDLKQFILG
jgi:hypothetical protein